MLCLTKVISWLLEVTATVNGALETFVVSRGPIYHPNDPPTPSRKPFVGLELMFGRTRARNFLGGFGGLSFLRKRSPIAPCSHFFLARVSCFCGLLFSVEPAFCPCMDTTAGIINRIRR